MSVYKKTVISTAALVNIDNAKISVPNSGKWN